jgi:predicted phage baseplate assembly protein
VTNLANAYQRDTVTLNANVALATHGETVHEVLGSGDASQSHQRFTLRQPPLTYVIADTPSGAESTLQVYVNDVQWHESPSLYKRGSEERVYVTRMGDDGKTTLQFGDGQTGARLPTGQENVRATYRKGSGLEGLVKANRLTLLLTRPLGVKSVTNPLPAQGAEDPESRDDARRNAPLTVLTLDRIVSLQDYEDFARAYGGIDKALATWTWIGEKRGVLVTVAGPQGALIPESSKTYENLLSAMKRAGDPRVPLRVKSYRPALFTLFARTRIDADYQPERVLAEVEQALRLHFSFEARQFGQAVMLCEVIAVIQDVPGVVGVNVEELHRVDPDVPGVIAVNVGKLHRSNSETPLPPVLYAAAPQAGSSGEVSAAELLTLDPRPLNLGTM